MKIDTYVLLFRYFLLLLINFVQNSVVSPIKNYNNCYIGLFLVIYEYNGFINLFSLNFRRIFRVVRLIKPILFNNIKYKTKNIRF